MPCDRFRALLLQRAIVPRSRIRSSILRDRFGTKRRRENIYLAAFSRFGQVLRARNNARSSRAHRDVLRVFARPPPVRREHPRARSGTTTRCAHARLVLQPRSIPQGLIFSTFRPIRTASAPQCRSVGTKPAATTPASSSRASRRRRSIRDAHARSRMTRRRWRRGREFGAEFEKTRETPASRSSRSREEIAKELRAAQISPL